MNWKRLGRDLATVGGIAVYMVAATGFLFNLFYDESLEYGGLVSNYYVAPLMLSLLVAAVAPVIGFFFLVLAKEVVEDVIESFRGRYK